jgi:hypothetical protein
MKGNDRSFILLGLLWLIFAVDSVAKYFAVRHNLGLYRAFALTASYNIVVPKGINPCSRFLDCLEHALEKIVRTHPVLCYGVCGANGQRRWRISTVENHPLERLGPTTWISPCTFITKPTHKSELPCRRRWLFVPCPSNWLGTLQSSFLMVSIAQHGRLQLPATKVTRKAIASWQKVGHAEGLISCSYLITPLWTVWVGWCSIALSTSRAESLLHHNTTHSSSDEPPPNNAPLIQLEEATGFIHDSTSQQKSKVGDAKPRVEATNSDIWPNTPPQMVLTHEYELQYRPKISSAISVVARRSELL